jgi:hypothetical protein
MRMGNESTFRNRQSERSIPMNYTPGPWTYTLEFGSPGYQSIYVRDAGRQQLYFLGSLTRFQKNENEANAMLISAAPDLLAACEHVMANYGHNAQDDCECEDCEYLRPVTQAIAKAKGEAQ